MSASFPAVTTRLQEVRLKPHNVRHEYGMPVYVEANTGVEYVRTGNLRVVEWMRVKVKAAIDGEHPRAVALGWWYE